MGLLRVDREPVGQVAMVTLGSLGCLARQFRDIQQQHPMVVSKELFITEECHKVRSTITDS